MTVPRFDVPRRVLVLTTTNNVYMLVFEHQASMYEKQPDPKGVEEHLVNRADETSISPSMRNSKGDKRGLGILPPTSTTSSLDESNTRPNQLWSSTWAPKPQSISYLPRQIPMHMPLSFLTSGAWRTIFRYAQSTFVDLILWSIQTRSQREWRSSCVSCHI